MVRPAALQLGQRVGRGGGPGVVDARKRGANSFPCDDLQNRSGITKAVVESLRQLGVLEALPSTSQMNFFEMG